MVHRAVSKLLIPLESITVKSLNIHLQLPYQVQPGKKPVLAEESRYGWLWLHLWYLGNVGAVIPHNLTHIGMTIIVLGPDELPWLVPHHHPAQGGDGAPYVLQVAGIGRADLERNVKKQLKIKSQFICSSLHISNLTCLLAKLWILLISSAILSPEPALVELSEQLLARNSLWWWNKHSTILAWTLFCALSI